MIFHFASFIEDFLAKSVSSSNNFSLIFMFLIRKNKIFMSSSCLSSEYF